MKATDKIGWPFGPAVQLLILTAARREEIGSLSWSEIRDGAIHLPAERNKSGEPRIISLAPMAAEVINALPRTGDHVFTTNGTTSISGWGKAKRALDAAAGEINGRPLAPWRLHDLRRSVATGMQRLGVGLQVVEAVLGHISGSRAGVVGIYQRHHFEAEQRAAIEAWAREIERITGRGDHRITPPAAQLTLTAHAPIIDIKPIDTAWMEAISRAAKTISPKPLIAYLNRPRAQLGPAETYWLRLLLEQITFKRKSGGRFVPFGQKSRQEIYEIGAAHVKELRRGGLPQAKAIDTVVKIYPYEWFGKDAGASLLNFIKRGSKHR